MVLGKTAVVKAVASGAVVRVAAPRVMTMAVATAAGRVAVARAVRRTAEVMVTALELATCEREEGLILSTSVRAG